MFYTFYIISLNKKQTERANRAKKIVEKAKIQQQKILKVQPQN
jgi:hypothetical protein